MPLTRLAMLACLISFPILAVDHFAEDVRSTEPMPAGEQISKFRLPPGFEVQLVASDPMISKPLNLNFDDHGRLWITDTREYPFAMKQENGVWKRWNLIKAVWEPLKPEDKGQDCIKVLEIDSNTGRANKITTFADGLNIPMGLYPYKDGVIAFNIPSIHHFQDHDRDGRAEKIDLLYGPFDYTRDTHGMCASFRRGFDGWLYATHGFNNRSLVKGKDGNTVKMNSGNTYRMKLDGERIEHFTYGQVNPFGLAFDAQGNLYSSDCHTMPLYQLLRGGYYPSFGAPHDGIGFAPEMMRHNHHSSGLCGVAYYAAESYPQEFRGNFFVCNVVTSKVNRDTPQDIGTTRMAKEQPDFVKCDDPWFRPVDLCFGPDGAIYIADFYNRIIGHYEVPLQHPGRDRERGRIWRIVYKGEGAQPMEALRDWAALPLDEKIKLLGHHNLALRTLVANSIYDRNGAEAVPALKAMLAAAPNSFSKIHGAWLLKRFAAEVPALHSDADPLVRTHAMKIFAETTEWNDQIQKSVTAALSDADPFVQRAAADALGRHANIQNVKPLLELLHRTQTADTHMVHTVRMAVRDQFVAAVALSDIGKLNLDDADMGDLASVLPSINTTDSAMFLLKYVQTVKAPSANAAAYLKHAARFVPDGEFNSVIAVAQNQGSDTDAKIAVFNGIKDGFAQRGAPAPDAFKKWGGELAGKVLSAMDEGKKISKERIQFAADTARNYGVKELASPLAKVVKVRALDGNARGEAVKALLALDAAAHVADLAKQLNDETEDKVLRDKMAQSFAEINLPAANAAVIEALKNAPQRTQTPMALAMAASGNGAKLVMRAIMEGKASPRLLQQPKIKEKLAAAKLPDFDKNVAQLTKGIGPLDAELEKMLAARVKAYAPEKHASEKGEAVFKQFCFACHQLNGQGTVVGPQLDGVSSRGIERLVEDVLDPNRNIDPAFRAAVFVMNDGKVITGLQRREEGELIVLADSTGKELTVTKKNIKSRSDSKASLMPDNLSEAIQPDDFNNLMKFLLQKKN